MEWKLPIRRPFRPTGRGGVYPLDGPFNIPPKSRWEKLVMRRSHALYTDLAEFAPLKPYLRRFKVILVIHDGGFRFRCAICHPEECHCRDWEQEGSEFVVSIYSDLKIRKLFHKHKLAVNYGREPIPYPPKAR